MKTKATFLLLSVFLFCSFNPFEKSTETPVEVVKFDAFDKLLKDKSNGLHVINFWATWCGPCIKELPYFEKLRTDYDGKLNVTLVSLDFVEELEKRVIPFVRKKKLQSQLLLLDEIDYNSWIDKVEPSWSGAIPATLIIDHRTGKRKFVEKELEPGELETMIREFID